MKSFIAVLALVAVAAADVSHLTRGPEADATVVKNAADVLPDGYQFIYETSNGISAQESGSLVKSGNDEAIAAQGGFGYTAPDGTQIRITYVADAEGFKPQGDHLPTPPPAQPIPEYIQRALAYIAAHPPKPEPTQYRN